MKRTMVASACILAVLCCAGVLSAASDSGLMQVAPDTLLKISQPAPGYSPFFTSLNEVYDTLEDAVFLHIDRAGFAKTLVFFLACCAGYAAFRKYCAPELRGEWMLDVASLEKQWIEAGGSPDSIGIIKQQLRYGRMTYRVSRGKITIAGHGRSVSFPYETLSVIGDITTGLLDERMVIIVWTPPKKAGRIISIRRASEREIFSSGEGSAHS